MLTRLRVAWKALRGRPVAYRLVLAYEDDEYGDVYGRIGGREGYKDGLITENDFYGEWRIGGDRVPLAEADLTYRAIEP